MKQIQNQIILSCIVFLLILGVFFSSALVQQPQDTRSSAAPEPKCLTYACTGSGVSSVKTYSCDQLYAKEPGCNSNPECKWVDGNCTGVAHQFYGCNIAADEYQCNNLSQQAGEEVTGSCAWTCTVYETPTLPPLSKDEVLRQKIAAELPRIKEFLAKDPEDKRKYNAQINILEGYLKGTVEAEDVNELLSQIEKEREWSAALVAAQKNARLTPGPNSSCLLGNDPCIAAENAYSNCKSQPGCTEAQAINARDEAYNQVMGDATRRANRGDPEAQKLVDQYVAKEAEQRRLAEEKKAQEEAAKAKAKKTPTKTATQPTQKPKTPEQIATEKVEQVFNKELLNDKDPEYLDNLMKLVRGQIAIDDVTFSLYAYDTNVVNAEYTIDGKTYLRQFYFDPQYGPAPWQFYVDQYNNIVNRNMADVDEAGWKPTITAGPTETTRETLIILGKLTPTGYDNDEDLFKQIDEKVTPTETPPTTTPPASTYNVVPTGTLPPQGKVPYAYNPPPPTELTPTRYNALPGKATGTPDDTPPPVSGAPGAPGVNGQQPTVTAGPGPELGKTFNPLDTDKLIEEWAKQEVRTTTPTPLFDYQQKFIIDTAVLSGLDPVANAIVKGLDVVGIDVKPSDWYESFYQTIIKSQSKTDTYTGEGLGVGIGVKTGGASIPYVPPLQEALQNFDLTKNLDEAFTQLGNNFYNFLGGSTPYTGPTYPEIPVTEAPAPTAPVVIIPQRPVTATETPSAQQIRENPSIGSLSDTYIIKTSPSVAARPNNEIIPIPPSKAPTGTPSAKQIKEKQQGTPAPVFNPPVYNYESTPAPVNLGKVAVDTAIDTALLGPFNNPIVNGLGQLGIDISPSNIIDAIINYTAPTPTPKAEQKETFNPPVYNREPTEAPVRIAQFVDTGTPTPQKPAAVVPEVGSQRVTNVPVPTAPVTLPKETPSAQQISEVRNDAQAAQEKIINSVGNVLDEEVPGYKANMEALAQGEIIVEDGVLWQVDPDQKQVLRGTYSVGGKTYNWSTGVSNSETGKAPWETDEVNVGVTMTPKQPPTTNSIVNFAIEKSVDLVGGVLNFFGFGK